MKDLTREVILVFSQYGVGWRLMEPSVRILFFDAATWQESVSNLGQMSINGPKGYQITSPTLKHHKRCRSGCPPTKILQTPVWFTTQNDCKNNCVSIIKNMSLLRNATRSTVQIACQNSNPCLAIARKHFSTEADSSPPAAAESPIEPFLRESSTGLSYGKLSGTTKYTMKSDLLHLLEGCNLTPDDVKFNYTRSFMPLGAMIQFPSRRDYEAAYRIIDKKGRLYRMERADRSQWELLKPYNGKTVILEGLPPNTKVEDIQRFLSGCDYDSTKITISLPWQRFALVGFPKLIEAMNAMIVKNRGFLMNNQISIRILQ